MILIVAGVAGSGKTTVGEIVARRLSWVFADGDDFHSPANVEKMERGIPLTDADREPWLSAIGIWMDQHLAAGTAGVVACSALKRHYRDRLLTGRPEAQLAFLAVSWDNDEARVIARKGHFFAEPLLASQFSTLEMPDQEERVHVVNSDGLAAEQVADDIITMCSLRPA